MVDEQDRIELTPTARELLARRDRFTRRAIEKDFAEKHVESNVLLDSDAGLYVTPVADDRYAVIWRRLEDRLVEVKAVVASRLTKRGNAAELKSSLEKALEFETNGLVKSL
ncbi:MAG: hypothetical protein ACREVG_04000 [Burkholderiales bacterium]